MTRERYQRIKSIFHEAAGQQGPARRALLERACGPDTELRQEVEKLLAGENSAKSEIHAFVSPNEMAPLHRAIENFAGAVPGSSAAMAAWPETVQDALPQVPGYTIERLIGSGGMGAVYAAQQHKPRRTVAIKVMRPGIASRSALRRFEFEAQVLAHLRHPSIAQVFEAGTFQSHGVELPYFVMEYIPDAVTLTEYAGNRQLDLRARLALFAGICDAIHCGHQKGVIHRDVKPSNILVDSSGSVKLIDFGVARAVDSDLAVTTLQTDAGQLIGTLQYMSPEQVSGQADDIDIRSDVYALGIVLYELLCGRLPYDLRGLAIHEAVRTIQQVQPVRPSMHDRALRGDVETIIQKALEKDRERRYQSAAEFGRDISRYLSGEAIQARPATALYQLRVFARRHRGAVAAGVAVFAALLIGVIGFAWQARLAGAQRDKAQRIAEFMSDMLKGVGPSVARGRDTVMLKEMVDNAAKRIEQGDLNDASEAELRLRLTIGDAYRNLSLFPDSGRLLEPAVPLARSIYPVQSPELADALYYLGSLERYRGDLQPAETHLQECIEIRRHLYPSGHRDLAQSITALGVALQARGESQKAAALFQEALEMFRRIDPGDNEDTAGCLNNLATTHYAVAEHAESEKYYLEALDMYERVHPGDHPDTANTLYNLAALRIAQGDFNDAERRQQASLDMRKRILPEGHVKLAAAQGAFGSLYFNRGDYARADSLFRETLATFRRSYPGDHSDIAAVLNGIAACSYYRGDLADAEALYVQAVEMRRRLNPNSALDLAPTLQNLVHLRLTRKDLAAADQTAVELIEMLRREFPNGHSLLADALNMRGLVLMEAKDFGRAEQCWREAIDLWRRLFLDGHLSLAGGLSNFAALFERRGDHEQAVSLSREAVGMYQRLDARNLWLCGVARLRLGRALTELNRFDEAESQLLEAHRILSTAQGVPAVRREECLKGLVKLYDDWNKADSRPELEQKATTWRAKLSEFAASQPASRPSS